MLTILFIVLFLKGTKITDLLDYIPDVFEQRIHEVTLLRLVKYTPKDTRNKLLTAFTIFCDPHYEINAYAKRCEDSKLASKRFSVIEYFSSTFRCKCVAQVIGIVKHNTTVSILVSRLVEDDVKTTSRKLPYPIFKYATEPHDNTLFTFECVPIEDVISPCFAIPAVEHKNNDFGDCGTHHRIKDEISYFYVLTTQRTGLLESLEYSDYVKMNSNKNPWNPRVATEKCFNFNFYLNDTEKIQIRDVINA